jgi:histidinol dehydrogenase
MMKLVKYPAKEQWKKMLQRPALDTTALYQKVRSVLDVVKQDGDTAVRQFTKQFDGVLLTDFLVPGDEINEAVTMIPDDLKSAIQQAADNIRRFHEKQVAAVDITETMPGIQCWRKSVGIEKVGLYIPGGTAPLFSTLLMLCIPARIAGCKEIILCSPPGREGKLPPAILYAAQLVGITKIFKIGGVQAIGAMAYGTATVPQVF